MVEINKKHVIHMSWVVEPGGGEVWGTAPHFLQQMQCKAQNGGFSILFPLCNFSLTTRAPPPKKKILLRHLYMWHDKFRVFDDKQDIGTKKAGSH